MFNWKAEEMKLMNEKSLTWKRAGREKIYSCENEVSREDKIAFVDSMQNGKLSYMLELLEKFQKDSETLPKQTSSFSGKESIKTVSLKAWIKRNDTKYNRPIIDDWYHYGFFNILGCERNIQTNYKGSYDVYEDLVDEVFHRQLKKCEEEERKYFAEHDEYTILKSKFLEQSDKYETTFGVPIVVGNGVFVGDFENKREITMDELKDLLSKYKQIDDLVNKLSKEIKIIY